MTESDRRYSSPRPHAPLFHVSKISTVALNSSLCANLCPYKISQNRTCVTNCSTSLASQTYSLAGRSKCFECLDWPNIIQRRWTQSISVEVCSRRWLVCSLYKTDVVIMNITWFSTNLISSSQSPNLHSTPFDQRSTKNVWTHLHYYWCQSRCVNQNSGLHPTPLLTRIL